MKERPILFSAAMVRAILDGSKIQTRRVVKLPHSNPLGQWEPTIIGGENGGHTAAGDTLPLQGGIWHTRTGDSLMCPYGQPGGRLWGRETWQAWKEFDMSMAASLPEEMRARINYPANGNTWDARLRPSIHMPRWASRILLEIVSVHVERLNDISESDCWAEGIEACDGLLDDMQIILHAKKMGLCMEDARATYAALWESINGAGSWDANPWVWVIEFKRVQP